MMKFTLASCFAAPASQLASQIGRWWRQALSLALVLVVATAMGCGGGDTNVAGVGSGGTGSFASGPITGFGSIIVNGIHFDETAAAGAGAITDDDGVAGSSSSLKLGMVVNVTGSPVNNSGAVAAATATAVIFVSELVGPIASINAASKTFVVLGQTIAVTGSTFFDDGLAGGLTALRAGDIVEVYGFYDSVSTTFSATRIEKKDSKAELKLIGEVASLNTTSKTFAIGSVTITYANINPGTLANGQVVRVKGKFNQAGLLDASRIRSQGIVAQSIGARDDVEIEGIVDPFTSPASFKVNGVTVDARSATVLGGAVAQGLRVEVEGSTTSDSILVARKVTVKSSSQIDMSEFEITGTVENLSPAPAKTFQVRGVTIDYSGATGAVQYDKGFGELDLLKLPAPTVDVKGMRSAGGTAVIAQRIKFK